MIDYATAARIHAECTDADGADWWIFALRVADYVQRRNARVRAVPLGDLSPEERAKVARVLNLCEPVGERVELGDDALAYVYEHAWQCAEPVPSSGLTPVLGRFSGRD